MLIYCFLFTAKVCYTFQISSCSNMKYKDTIPKPPPTPYMLFSKSKQPKLKQKYPNLPMTEVAMKLGEREINYSLRIV